MAFGFCLIAGGVRSVFGRRRSMYLPEDLAREILLKVRSTKSAVRLSSVCKSWRDLVFKDPDFGAKFFNKKDDPILLFHRHKHSDDQHEYQIRTRNSHVSLGFPEKVVPKLKEIGSCNGILCLQETIPMDIMSLKEFRGSLYNYVDQEYYPRVSSRVNLYNPITREYRRIPPPCVVQVSSRVNLYNPIIHGYRRIPPPWVGAYGFGFDSTTCDYKVIRITHNAAQIYKFSTNCWSKLEVSHESIYDGNNWSDSFVYAKGCCYWRSDSGIVSFDFRTESFGFIDKPRNTRDSYDLGLLDNNTLAACIPRLYDEDRKTYTTEIRVRSKGGGDKASWDVCFSVRGDFVLGMAKGANFGACWVEDGTLFQLRPDGEVTTYERRGSRDGKSRLFRFDSPLYSMTFKPSLVPLGSNCFVHNALEGIISSDI